MIFKAAHLETLWVGNNICSNLGQFGIFMLDAKKSTSKFWCSIANDFKVLASIENFHFGSPYEESGIRIMSRI